MRLYDRERRRRNAHLGWHARTARDGLREKRLPRAEPADQRDHVARLRTFAKRLADAPNERTRALAEIHVPQRWRAHGAMVLH
jgi:hypothetical protein